MKEIEQFETVSYGAEYVASNKEWIATLPIGYADGFSKRNQGRDVWISERCPIVGRICMDQFMVKMPEKMPVGTKVEIISADPTAPNNIKAAADYVDTIHYEVACLLNDRLPRVYYEK